MIISTSLQQHLNVHKFFIVEYRFIDFQYIMCTTFVKLNNSIIFNHVLLDFNFAVIKPCIKDCEKHCENIKASRRRE